MLRSLKATGAACTLAILVGATMMTGCARAPGLSEAKSADFDGLREKLEKSNLTPDQVRLIAKAALRAEVIRAKDREERPFIRSLRTCSSDLIPALQQRAELEDGLGAEAALILFETGNWNGTTRGYADHEDGAWRALSARTTVGNGDARRKYFSDPDERVRRASLSAALEAADPNDVDELLEVSRVDPDPLSRNRAYQAMGRIGGDRVSTALKDRFGPGSEEIKLAIVDAWGMPAVYTKGGKRELKRLMSHQTGFVALHAASILARKGDSAVENQAVTRLVRFTTEGTTQEKRMALRMLPAGRPETTEQLLALSEDEDQETAVIAWARLLSDPMHKKKAQKVLAEWARSDKPIAYQARSALAAAADDNVLPLLQRQAKSDDAGTRRVAGYGLVRLGAWGELAPLLADKNPNVRRSIACRTLAKRPKPQSY